MTIQQFKFENAKKLPNSQTPLLDIDVLLCHILNCDKTHLLLQQNRELKNDETVWLLDAVEKRQNGVPVAYITGHKEFFALDFVVLPDVLIPKPDTETLVEKAISYIKNIKKAKNGEKIDVLDIFTGSGCVGLSVFNADKKINLNMSDISFSALEIAKKNATRLFAQDAEKIKFIESDLFENIFSVFDMILANPPYVPPKMAEELLKDGRNEPILALDGGGKDGLEIIKRFLTECTKHLKKNGVLFMETGEYNAEKAFKIAKKCGFENVKIHKDLSGQMRVIEAKWNGAKL